MDAPKLLVGVRGFYNYGLQRMEWRILVSSGGAFEEWAGPRLGRGKPLPITKFFYYDYKDAVKAGALLQDYLDTHVNRKPSQRERRRAASQAEAYQSSQVPQGGEFLPLAST